MQPFASLLLVPLIQRGKKVLKYILGGGRGRYGRAFLQTAVKPGQRKILRTSVPPGKEENFRGERISEVFLLQTDKQAPFYESRQKATTIKGTVCANGEKQTQNTNLASALPPLFITNHFQQLPPTMPKLPVNCSDLGIWKMRGFQKQKASASPKVSSRFKAKSLRRLAGNTLTFREGNRVT